jgi:hypothetical protein
MAETKSETHPDRRASVKGIVIRIVISIVEIRCAIRRVIAAIMLIRLTPKHIIS